MDNLNTNKITLGNMGQTEISPTLPDPQESTRPDGEEIIDLGEQSDVYYADETSKSEVGVKEESKDEPTSDSGMGEYSNLLLFGGLILALFFIKKKV